MDFFKNLAGKMSSENEEKKKLKKQLKTKDKVLELLTKGQIDEFRIFVPVLKKEDEASLLGIEAGITEALEKEPALHENLKKLFVFLFESNSPALFQLFYDSLLFNVSLYRFLIEAFECESEEHFDYKILMKAEDFEDKETKVYILGVLAYLKDSFLARIELDEKNKNKDA